MGSDATRALMIACMVLASRNNDNDGSFNGEPEYIKRFAYLNSKPDFKPLIENGFIEPLHDASELLASCNTEKRREETEKSRGEKREFVLPDWINADDWNLWIKTRKGKKMIPEQMEAQVKKLQKWKDAGLPYWESLKSSADNGYQGLFEPKVKFKTAQDSRLDFVNQVMGNKNGTDRQIRDITGECSAESDRARIPEIIDGLWESNVE